MVSKFHYTERIHVNNWISGGRVLLHPASWYLLKDKSVDGVWRTKNETRIINTDIANDANAHIIPEGLISCTGNGVFHGTNITFGEDDQFVKAKSYSDTFEDGLVMCFSNEQIVAPSDELDSKVCLIVDDVEVLLSILSKQIGTPAIHRRCDYTSSISRDTFTKGIIDEWMDEYRAFWNCVPGPDNFYNIPKGLAKLV